MGSHHTRHTGRRRVAPIALLAAGIVLSGCAGNDDQDASEVTGEAVDERAAEEPAELMGGDAAIPTRAPAQASEGSDGGFDLGIVGRDVIVEMYVLMSSDDIARSVASITASASQLGGGIASSNVDYGDPSSGPTDGSSGHAVLVVKVPPDQVDRLVSGLDTTGSVRSIEQSAEDVTEQLVDLEVRIENARESVTNVRALMDQATSLTDLVTLESELTRRQTELEQLEAQQRNLDDRVELATVTVEVVPTDEVPVVDDGGESLGDAIVDGWRAFGTFLFAIVYLVAILLPFLTLGVVALAVTAWIVRRRHHRTHPAPSGPESDAHEPRKSDHNEDLETVG